MEEVNKHFNVSEVVWARARKPKSEIFWPAQIVTTENTPRKLKSKIIATVKFLGEDTYEDVKDAKDIMEWDCKEQCSFIQDGRALIKKPQKKICFNKGVAEAKKLFSGHNGHDNKDKELEEDLQRPHKISTSSDIKFVDEDKNVNVITKQCNTTAQEMKYNEACKSGRKQQNCAHKRVKRNKSEEQRMDTNEPNFKRTKGIGESFIRTSLKKSCGRDQPSNKVKMKIRKNVFGKDVSNKKYFVGKDADDERQSERNGKSSSQAVNRKRKRGEKSKQNGCKDATCDSKDKEINNSNSLTRSSKQQEKEDRKAKFPENKQSHKKGIKRPLPNIRDIDNASVIETVKSEKNSDQNVQEREKVKKEKWESDSCSDEELMETVLSPSSKDLKFELNDIVWAKLYREPFWPAQVKRITGNKKAKKFYVQFLGYCNQKCFSCKRLVPFSCDSKKREEFVVEGKRFDAHHFDEALTIAEDLVRRKALGIQEQNEEEVGEFVDTDDVQDATLIATADQLQKEVGKPLNTDDVKSLEESVITKRPSRTLKRPSRYKDILTYIKEGKSFLKEIFEEKKSCHRHQIFKTGSAKDKNSLKRRSGFGPISDSDLENDIMELLQDYYREVVGSDGDFSEVTYISDVWLPEAIIYALQKLEKVDRKTAEALYLQGSSHGTRGKRFTQRLKAKTLTEEERVESLQRAEKAFSRSFSL